MADGLVFAGNDGEQFKITQLSINKKMIPAHTWGVVETNGVSEITLDDAQKELLSKVKA